MMVITVKADLVSSLHMVSHANIVDEQKKNTKRVPCVLTSGEKQKKLNIKSKKKCFDNLYKLSITKQAKNNCNNNNTNVYR